MYRCSKYLDRGLESLSDPQQVLRIGLHVSRVAITTPAYVFHITLKRYISQKESYYE